MNYLCNLPSYDMSCKSECNKNGYCISKDKCICADGSIGATCNGSSNWIIISWFKIN